MERAVESERASARVRERWEEKRVMEGERERAREGERTMVREERK